MQSRIDNNETAASVKSQRKIVLTGGGTAGHVTPNLALIPQLRKNGFEVYYIGTADGIERTLVSDSVDHYYAVPWGKLRRYFSFKNFTDPFRVLAGIRRSRKLLKKIKPSCIFSKGGYASVPVVIASRGLAPVVAHESDYTAGLATKISNRYAVATCVSFEDTAAEIKRNAIFTGTPIRGSVFEGNAERARSIMGVDGEKPLLLVMCGSLGSVAVNEAVFAALPELSKHFNIAHVCGKGKSNPTITAEGYRQFEYVTDELSHLFAAASLVVSRAGANSVFEFLALKLPNILVPLPSKSSRGDQLKNAEYFEKRGYSAVLRQEGLTGESLLETCKQVYADREKYIAAMAADKTASNGVENVMRVILSSAKKD